MSGSQALHTVTRLLKYGDQARRVTGCAFRPLEGQESSLEGDCKRGHLWWHAQAPDTGTEMIMVVGGSKRM